jgi:hypothetical protein
VAASFKVSRAAPKSARVRGTRIKPEAHGYIDVKACAVACVSAAVENPEREIQTDEYCTFQPVGLSVGHDVAHDMDCNTVRNTSRCIRP